MKGMVCSPGFLELLCIIFGDIPVTEVIEIFEEIESERGL